jgi:hypothetical protein
MQTDLKTLKQIVIDTAKRSPLARRVAAVELEPARDDDGDAYLRVIVRVKNVDRADKKALANLIEAIEDAVSKRDERYPSVRFPDAA